MLLKAATPAAIAEKSGPPHQAASARVRPRWRMSKVESGPINSKIITCTSCI